MARNEAVVHRKHDCDDGEEPRDVDEGRNGRGDEHEQRPEKHRAQGRHRDHDPGVGVLLFAWAAEEEAPLEEDLPRDEGELEGPAVAHGEIGLDSRREGSERHRDEDGERGEEDDRENASGAEGRRRWLRHRRQRPARSRAAAGHSG